MVDVIMGPYWKPPPRTHCKRAPIFASEHDYAQWQATVPDVRKFGYDVGPY
jgi:hypothetical protein